MNLISLFQENIYMPLQSCSSVKNSLSQNRLTHPFFLDLFKKDYIFGIIKFLKQNQMKKLFLFVLFSGIISLAVSATVSKNNKAIIGEWKYEVQQAPYGYQKGVIAISEKEGKLVGEVKFEDGYKIALKTVSYEKGELKVGLYIDYEYIEIKAKVDGKKMKGTVSSPEGPLSLEAEKK